MVLTDLGRSVCASIVGLILGWVGLYVVQVCWFLIYMSLPGINLSRVSSRLVPRFAFLV